jgi:repressor LexA
MTQQPTKRQAMILSWIAQHISRHGYQPSIREIGEKFRIRSPNGVVCHLKSLERKGLIDLNKNTARAIRFNWRDWSEIKA